MSLLIQVGSNDCVSDDFDKDTFREEYCALVEIARSASDNVLVLHVIPMFSANLYDPDRLRCTPSLWYNLMLMDLFFALVEIARSASDNVVISGICPRLDDKDGHISAGNIILSKIAHDENLSLADLAISTSAQYSSRKVSLSKSSLTQSLLPT
jgi:hypothetical protein